MRSREFTKRIEFYQTTSTKDSFGSNLPNTETILATSWASVKTTTINKGSEDVGVFNPTNTYKFRLRKRNDIDYTAVNQFIKYRGDKYKIVGEPLNINFRDNIIEILTVQIPNKN